MVTRKNVLFSWVQLISKYTYILPSSGSSKDSLGSTISFFNVSGSVASCKEWTKYGKI